MALRQPYRVITRVCSELVEVPIEKKNPSHGAICSHVGDFAYLVTF
jgi:hypothetical protein